MRFKEKKSIETHFHIALLFTKKSYKRKKKVSLFLFFFTLRIKKTQVPAQNLSSIFFIASLKLNYQPADVDQYAETALAGPFLNIILLQVSCHKCKCSIKEPNPNLQSF